MALASMSRTLPLMAAVLALACGEEPVEPLSRSTNKVLLLGSSVSGGLNSREAVAVASSRVPEIHVVTPAQWSAMTAEQFMSYRAIIIGDGACESGTAAFQAAINNRSAWGAIVDGNVALLSTDPTTNHTAQLVENAIRFVLDSPSRLTGMYIALGCAYQHAPVPSAVQLLEPFGAFQVAGVPGCADAGHIFQMVPSWLSDNLSDGSLSGDGCAARSVFTSYPDHTFAFAALAQRSQGAPIPGEHTYADFSQGEEVAVVGTPYLVVRGAMAQGAGCGTSDEMTGEECDLGDGINGQPALPGQSAGATCSYSCRLNWCGDGVVDALHGEECDNGINNGRTSDSSASIGTCTSFCKIPHLQGPSSPPVAVCGNVTIAATLTCGVPADINAGSSDPDGDLVGCTQSPAGPYDIGATRVTLTCVDQANHTATCSGVVTVRDQVAPTVTVEGPANQTVECVAGGSFTPPGATASDPCTGPLPPGSITVTGSVNVGVPNTNPGYTLSYIATDSSGNSSAPSVVRVAVADTLSPDLTLRGPATQRLECGTPYTDPGATASDLCAGELTGAIVRTGTVSSRPPGHATVSYSVVDGVGHTASKSRTIDITDTLFPTLTVNGPLTQRVMCGTQYTDPGATAFDLCAGDLTPQIVVSGSANPAVAGQYTVSYRVGDGAGHVATASRQVTVASVNIRLGDYTLFLLQNYSGGHDVKGKVAAGGNITLTDFSVGEDLPNNNVSRLLVAGGTLSLARGSVWGESFYGASYHGDATVTFHRGTLARGTPINFAARFAELRSLSSQLAALTPTGTVTRSTGGYILLSLTGTNPEVNVFEVNASDLAGINQLAFTAPADSLVVVNVRGTSATLANLGITMSGGLDAHGILYNFPDATTLSAGSIGIWGTILAPYAHVTFNNGNWDGGIYAVSLTGTAEGHLNALNNRAPCQ
ncbi:choice-of-anchor A family protein [Hyalangium sp.]|uniref:choice-of-anchor A family protein n=1 Tax=Hyalangium sp. TaxID=2028555 RepID=UPI002D3516DB|nr:choice-of-anchor A family protein [Hyalangium sp.]HYH97806.1 choice-of-anchor A family protein [Hyalangium sp.]